MEIEERDDEMIVRRIVMFECMGPDGQSYLRLDESFKDRKEAEWFGEALQGLGQQLVEEAKR